MPATAYPHVEINADGEPCIDGTRTRVIDVAIDHVAYKWGAEAIQRQHPHLSLGQIHSALAYYFDHQEELDRHIRERERVIDEFFTHTPEPPIAAKLRALRQQST
ncbi:MAG TPA: DUF433 domain-containing protein [Tepidisphaeraceae bacterium]|nr:DUF433 domain-containing protein [Tepidisphaeraceae bacterium]